MIGGAVAAPYYRLGDTTGAQERLDGLLETRPDQARALYYKAQILMDQADFDAAVPLRVPRGGEPPFAQGLQRGALTVRGALRVADMPDGVCEERERA